MIVAETVEVTKLTAKFGEAILSAKDNRGDLYVCVNRDKLVEIVQFLKDDDDLAFDYFVECVGADYSRWEHPRDLDGRFEVIYNLMSTTRTTRIFLKVSVNDGQSIPTLKDVFMGAEYPEREVNDLFGVHFAGNEQSTRFLLPDDWVGYPLRKEYPLGGEDVLFDGGDRGPAVEDLMVPHAGESFEGKTGSHDVSGR
ncbi:NuoC NADH,ubiquinone oxidoreductase 27 kD subunit [Fimbriimonadaceae bacterium]